MSKSKIIFCGAKENYKGNEMKGLQMQKLPTKPPFRYRSRKLRSFGAWDARNTPRLRSDIAASKIVEKKNYSIVK
ncbi:hypothetical protein EYC80_009465 [Monilinia laxa]|uniref:Uncharacterized protein n=1 Tax=Monilinia laxa TaxID=61186 RepID=A0A5N6JXX1_MONLA|nr:hypothetical protein EYC80_009465 [Monilinia laxa]